MEGKKSLLSVVWTPSRCRKWAPDQSTGLQGRRPVKNAVHKSNLYRPRFWQVDSPEVLLIDGPLLFSIWMASGPHVAMIFYPPFSTTHFFLLISLAYTYAYHRIVISQQRWDPEQHFDVKKQGWSFDKILSTRDSNYMQHFYWNGGSTIYLMKIDRPKNMFSFEVAIAWNNKL